MKNSKPIPITNQDLFTALTDLALLTEGHFDQLNLNISKLELQVRSMAYEIREISNRLDDIDGRLLGVENDVKDLYLCLPATI